MFKLHKHRSDKLGERVEFRFSSFRAIQIPKGWDKIFLSIVSVETGKSIAKTGKANVRNGACQWPDSISESVSIYHDSVSKELEDCPYKIIVSMGSARTGVLGEITLNLTDYLKSSDPSVVSSQLKKCNFGTTLQFKIHSVSAKSRSRDGKFSHHEEQNSNNGEIDNKSESAGSSGNQSGPIFDELGTRETSLSASGSHRSSNSGDSVLDKPNLSPRNNNSNGSGCGFHMGRQDSTGSFVSNNSSFSSRASGSSLPQANTFSNGLSQLSSSLGPTDSSKELLEAAEETIEELRDEAKMWERHSRKLKLELESLKKENSEKSKHFTDLEMELSEVSHERDVLKKEIEKLKSLNEELNAREINLGTPRFDRGTPRFDDVANLKKELEDELRFQKESNANLNLQLKKTQDANVELLSVLQELEETVEAQKLEMSKQSNGEDWERKIALKDEEILILKEKLSGLIDSEDHERNVVVKGDLSDLERENETLRLKVQELERDCAELTDENLDLIYKMKDLNKGTVDSIPDSSDSEIRKLRSKIQQLEEELREKDLNLKSEGSKSESDEFESNLLLKEQEIDNLKHFKNELENEKVELEETLAVVRKENSISSRCLEDVKFELTVLNNSIESHISTNKLLESKAKDLESCNKELELHVTELEQENIQLSERISGLEAQLRYLTNDRESNRVELDDSRSLITELKDKVERQNSEMETFKLEQKEKLLEAQNRMQQALEETEVLRRANMKIQATAEGLIEECNSLQKLNSNLRRQKVELHECVTRLELQLEEAQKKSYEFATRVDLLEGKLSSLQKDVSAKEQSLLSELERIYQEHMEQEERINRTNITLNKIETEKSAEVENLEREIENLTSRLNLNSSEQEKIELDSLHEVSTLRSDKVRLESNLKDANSQIKIFESEIETLKRESKNKVQGLVDLLNASKQSEEMLMGDIEHVQKLLETTKSNEEKFKKLSNEFEVKLKSSDYEKNQIMEEINELKTQVQKISQLQEEILGLKSSLDETKFEKGKIEGKLLETNGECEELRAERAVLMDRVSSMEKALNSGEDERRSKTVLEAKLVRLQSDLSAKEAQCAVEMELKNEISRIKRANSEYQRKIQCLEQERDELVRKSHKDEGHEEAQPDDAGPNNVQKARLESSLSGKQSCQTEINSKIQSLEAELKEMKERYLNMSLQYAEVEAQREQLVMQLKSVNKKEKRWFS